MKSGWGNTDGLDEEASTKPAADAEAEDKAKADEEAAKMEAEAA